MSKKFFFDPSPVSRMAVSRDQLKTEYEQVKKSIKGASGAITEEQQELIVPVFDRSLPLLIPDYQTDWKYRWNIRITKYRTIIDLNKLSIRAWLAKNIFTSRKLYNTEIHVLWFSHLPQNLFPEYMTISLNFTQSTDTNKRTMAENPFPGYLYTHHIFYPGHSIELHNSPLPWEIEIDHSEIPVASEYVMGEVFVRIVAKQTEAPRMEEEKLSQMIAMAPLSQPICGITLTRPRTPSTNWIQGYVKRGIDSKAKTEKLLKLMDAGVNVEGAALAKKLDAIISNVPMDALDRRGDDDAKKIILNSTLEALRAPRETKIFK
ncbi:TPA_asm: P3 [Arceuthobium sichuanense virus 2]|uniref:Protein 3 n=1 Tax=Picea virus 1 TaxID=2977979 RepID=A0A9N6YJH3_9RHAB|nr:TPA_asm: P3 [Arceuthobium sichuanense virus 2]DAZ90774.1 TPA_asm: protein 3 [Picea virus 1]